MATKKTKKPAVKKTAAKKRATKKAAAKTTPNAPLPAPNPQHFDTDSPLNNSGFMDDIDTQSAEGGLRRPPSGPDIPQLTIGIINHELNDIKTTLEDYAEHLRALDRMRLNGVGIKKQGFINLALAVAQENQEFLPHYLTIERFRRDNVYLGYLRDLVGIAQQIRELLWNITIVAADIAYTDALEYYASVREAAKRRVDAAESIFRQLEPFFKKMGMRYENGEGTPTKKQQMRDAKAIINSKRDGKIVLENIKPKLSGGAHKVIDEQFKDTEQFKETAEGEFKE